MARMHELASASLPYERVPNILRYTVNNLFMPLTLKKWGAYCLSLVRLFKKNKARVLKFHIWIPHQKIAYPYFFFLSDVSD